MAVQPLFRKAAIVGVGQIGGSVAWAIKRKKLASQVVGVSQKSHLEAKRLGAIDKGYFPDELAAALKGADLVVLALPVAMIESFVRDRSKTALIDPKAVVIDVGSTKVRIAAAARKGALKSRFVGCHPMAGSEKSGAAAANPELFNGAVCFMTSRDARVHKLWKALGAEPIVLDPASHDRWVAHASHMPHLLAFLLLAGFPSGGGFRANPSVRDLARISKSGPELWTEIFNSNSGELLTASRAFEKKLHAFNASLKRGDLRSVKSMILSANARSQKAFPSTGKRA